MNIYKFGGASVRDAESIKNLFQILNTQKTNLIIVVSAMGKMTDALESLCHHYFNKTGETAQALQNIKEYHFNIIRNLFTGDDREVCEKIERLFADLEAVLETEPSLCYDYEYDRIISFGELLSTTIVAAYLEKQGRKAKLVDIRKCIKTDVNYRNANVNPELSGQ